MAKHPVSKAMSGSLEQSCASETNYPSDFVHPDKKNSPEWCMQFAKAFYAQFINGRLDTPYNFSNKHDYNMLRLYGDGNEPIDKIRNQLTIKAPRDPNKQDTRRIAYTSISWDNESVFPRYMETVLGILQDFKGNHTVRAVDQASFDAKERMKWSIWERSQNQFYTKLAQATGKQLIDDVPFVPADLNELETYETMAMELQHEEEMKDAIDRCFELSGWEVISTMLKKDLINIGFIGTKVKYDRATKKPLIEYIDGEMALLPKSRYPDYRDANTFGHIDYLTIHELRANMKKINKFESEQKFIESIKESYGDYVRSVAGMNAFDDRGAAYHDQHGYLYDSCEIPVLFVEHRTWNEHVYSKRTTKYGVQTYVEDFDFKLSDSDKKRGVQVSRKTYEMWYNCAWVIGTKMCINWGPNEFVVRDKAGRAYSNYNFYRMSNKSITSLAIPKINRITVACKKFQIAWAQAAPNGFMINFAALQGITYGGKALTEREIVKVYLDTGKLFVNVDPNNPKKAVGFIIQQLPGGLGNTLNDFIGTYNATIQELNDITGVTQPLLGAAPVSNQLNGVTEMAQQSAMSRLKPIVSAIQHMRRACAMSLVSNIQTMAMFEEEFSDMWFDINKNRQRRLRIPQQAGQYNYQIFIDEDESPMLRQEIIRTAQESASRSAQGDPTQLTYPDYLLIVEYVERGKVRFARHLMERRLAKRAAIAQMTNLQNVQANQQAQMQTAEQVAMNEEKRLRSQAAVQMQLDDNKSENKEKEIVTQGKVDIEVERATGGGKQPPKPPAKKTAAKKSTQKKS